MANAALPRKQGAKAYLRKLGKDIWRDGDAYLLVVPVLLYFFLFHYKSMYGAIIAFKDFAPMRGILGSPWADNYGFAHFISFFESYYFGRLLRNTLTISLATLVFGFPAPIILALLLNEVRSTRFKRFVQTITYMPHFISMVVICSMIRMFVAENGVITQMLLPFGIKQGSMLSHPEYFVPLYVISGIWQEIGWGSIIYIAALSGISPELYEAAKIDGCSYPQIFGRVILPLITPALVTGGIFSFMWRWDDFLSALLYVNKSIKYPVSLALKLFCDPGSSSDYGAMFAMASLSILPSVIIFIFFQKYLVEGISTSGLKG